MRAQRRVSVLVACLVSMAMGNEQIDKDLQSVDCDTFTDCNSCAGATSWSGTACRWCPYPGDNSCHAYGSLVNPCSDDDQVTSVDTCAAKIAPKQVHIALAGEDVGSGMSVMWQTYLKSDSPTVRWGTSASDMSNTEAGSTNWYYEEGSYNHVAVLSGLSPGTTYWYQAGDSSVDSYSETFSFTTPKATADSPLKVAVVGDMGRAQFESGDVIASLSSHAANNSYDFLWFLGDIGYADDSFIHSGSYVQFDYENAYNEFMDQIEPFAATKPMMVLPGNHEAECHSPNCQLSPTKVKQLSNFSAYVHRFRMPYEESGATSNMWYSFDVPPVHFVNIDTETDYANAPNDSYTPFTSNGGFANGGSWTDWLEADLEKVDRSTTPFVVVGGHRPIYSVTACDNDGNPADDSANLQAAIEDILYAHKVDVYFAGHKHAYERSYPVYQSVKESESYASPRAPVHVVTGAGGCDEGHDDYDSKAVATSWHVMHNTANWGYGMLVVDETSLSWTQYDAKTDDVIDTFTLTH